MRALVVLLLVLNLVFFAWSRGWLDRITGVPAQGSSEAHRLQRQEHPERIEILDAATTAALTQQTCLELGPLDGDAPLAAAQAALRASNLVTGEWLTRTAEQPGSYVVATIRLDNAEFRARKEATYKQLKLDTEPLTGLPAEQPALVLGRFATEAQAHAELASLDKRGLKGLRVLQVRAPSRQHYLVLREADGITAGKLRSLKDPALSSGFKTCSTATHSALPPVAAAAASAPLIAGSAASH